MHSVLNLVKWLLICIVFLLWLALSLINHAVSTALVVFPGYLEFEHVPLAVILIFPLVVAFVTFYIVGLLDQVGHVLSSRELKKRIRELEDEVRELRNMPIREGMATEKTVEEENP